jgi:hypothetical protein
VRPDKPRPRALTAAVVVLVLALVLGVAGFLITSNGEEPAARVKPLSVETTTVTRTDLATTLNLDGKLGYGSEKAIKVGSGGQVTWLPRSGSTITRGEQLFRVDDQPIPLLYGNTPLFRRLDRRGLVGRDVTVVADNLKALGYSIGAQPVVGSKITQPGAGTPKPNDAPGAGRGDRAAGQSGTGKEGASTDDAAAAGGKTAAGKAAAGKAGEADGADAVAGTLIRPGTSVEVRPGDAVLTRALIAAIKRWQEDLGATPTGILDSGAAVVQPGRIRVGSVTGQLGDPADSALISATRMAKVVTVDVQTNELESIRASKRVTVTLPSGKTAKGEVGRISRVVAAPEGGGGGPDDQPRSTVTITLDKPSLIKDLDSAPVQVEFVAEARKNVLSVPVGALLALSEGGYGLQLKDGNLLPVSTGLFAKGLVEISGAGITEGMAVVTTS